MISDQDVSTLAFPRTHPACVAYWLALFGALGFFTWAAAYSLLHARALSWPQIGACAFWLLLVCFWLSVGIADAGSLQRAIIRAIDLTGGQPIVEIDARRGRPTLRRLVALGPCRLPDRAIEIDQIQMLSSGQGQISAVTGTDCDDWSITLWLDRPDLPSANDLRCDHRRDNQVSVADNLSSAQAEELTTRLITMLQRAGHHLVPGEREGTFVAA